MTLGAVAIAVGLVAAAIQRLAQVLRPGQTPRTRSTPSISSRDLCQAVQEALASGVPVVAPDTGGPRDLVLPDRSGYLVGDDAALRGAVARLLDP